MLMSSYNPTTFILNAYKLSYLKSFYYFHNLLKALNILCIESQFYILEPNYIYKELSHIYCNLLFIVRSENSCERIPIVKV